MRTKVYWLSLALIGMVGCSRSLEKTQLDFEDLNVSIVYPSQGFQSTIDTISDNSNQSEVVWEIWNEKGQRIRFSYDRIKHNNICSDLSSERQRDILSSVLRQAYDKDCNPRDTTYFLGDIEFVFFECPKVALAYACIGGYDVDVELTNFPKEAVLPEIISLKKTK